MNQHQEIISKPPALYKNMGPQDKPRPTTQKSNADPQKNDQEDPKFQLPPELADLFQDDRNTGQENSHEESKSYNQSDDYGHIPSGYDGSNPHDGEEDQDDYEDDDEDGHRFEGMQGGSKKIGKINRMNNKKPQQMMKKRMPMRG